jgi:hypothetical protein
LCAHVEQVDEEVVRQRLGPLGEDAVRGLPGIRAQEAKAADENRLLALSRPFRGYFGGISRDARNGAVTELTCWKIKA